MQVVLLVVLVALIKFMGMRQPAGVVEGTVVPPQSARTSPVRQWHVVVVLRRSRQRNVSAAIAVLGML
ncbi:hypothetical protein [Baekduia sp.]|jgi:hypothetical protein|uniref:hypothetical protein n=1 Tax=Baekduia sp. TaxID=2600305 RepID=UPI002E057F5E|nr:hypothetical protein [Baekduia sp.]